MANDWKRQAEQYDNGTMEYVVSCEHNGTRFYLTPEGTASDIGENARVFGRIFDCADEARASRADPAWRGQFDWQVTDVWNGIAIV